MSMNKELIYKLCTWIGPDFARSRKYEEEDDGRAERRRTVAGQSHIGRGCFYAVPDEIRLSTVGGSLLKRAMRLVGMPLLRP